MREKILRIVSNYAKTDTITPDSELITDLGINSIDLVSMVMDFEDEFGVTVPDEALAGIKTVKDIEDLIR